MGEIGVTMLSLLGEGENASLLWKVYFFKKNKK